jgi:hypothetical protein
MLEGDFPLFLHIYTYTYWVPQSGMVQISKDHIGMHDMQMDKAFQAGLTEQSIKSQ